MEYTYKATRSIMDAHTAYFKDNTKTIVGANTSKYFNTTMVMTRGLIFAHS